MVTKSPITKESTKETVKTIAQGRPDVPANLWLLPPCFLLHRGLRVRQAPGFPCALISLRDKFPAQPGRIASREGGVIFQRLREHAPWLFEK
jgi:hypothetical protein